MHTQEFQAFNHLMQVFCARAKLFAHMVSLKKTLEAPDNRVWSVCHVALTSPTSWSLRLQSIEPDAPEHMEETHPMELIDTMERLKIAAPLPMTSAWQQRLSCITNDDLSSEQWRHVTDALFSQLWILGGRLGAQSSYRGYTLDHIEVLEQGVAVLFFRHEDAYMLARVALAEALLSPEAPRLTPTLMPFWDIWTDPFFNDLDTLDH